MSKLLVSAYSIGHDSNLSFFNLETEKLYYIKFERLNNNKHYAANQHKEFLVYLNFYGFGEKDIKDIVFVKAPVHNNLFKIEKINGMDPIMMGHHDAHLRSADLFGSNFLSGIVYDGEGSDGECLSIFNNNLRTVTYFNDTHYSFGLAYNNIFNDLGISEFNRILQGWQYANALQTDVAGKVMAYDAYGEYLPLWQQEHKDLTMKDILKYCSVNNFLQNSYKWTDEKDEFKLTASLVKNLTYKVSEEILSLLKLNFSKEDFFSFSGGVAQNLILNNKFKENFPNLEIYPHIGDEGLSLGGVAHLLDKHNYDKKHFFKNLNKFPFIQCDENMGRASSKTIKATAEKLAQGKIVLWCQENGELGPRALGNRSILMNPAIVDAKERVNEKVKNREWYRPYAASVKVDKYKKYFDLPWESPYMLYQAQVKDQDKFKSITHADGTCRIQTVDKNHDIFYELLDEFEKLTGFPILLNTSLNLPGKPIVGRKQIAFDMFKNSEADFLVIGNERYR